MMVFPPDIFDRDLYERCQSRASIGEASAALNQAILHELEDRLSLITRHFDYAAIVGRDAANLSEALMKGGQFGTITTGMPTRPVHALISVLDLHCVNDVPQAIDNFARYLLPDGLFLACLFCGETLWELRYSWLEAEQKQRGGVSPRLAPMIDLKDLGGLLQRSQLCLPVVDRDRFIVRYDSAFALMHEIKMLGFSNCLKQRSRTLTTPALLSAAHEIYARNFCDPDGRVRASLEIGWATAWAPHISQPKALKPGSAQHSLAEALHTIAKQ